MRRRRPVLALIPLFALAGCAGGAGPDRPPLRFAQVSPNGELLGLPTPDVATHAQTLGAWHAKADADGDGRLTRDEMAADAARVFAAYDLNGDGHVTAVELTQARTASPHHVPHAPEPRPSRRRPPAPVTIDPSQVEAVPDGQRGPRARLRMGLDPVMSADADADFRVTAAEMRAHAAGRLAAWDADGDGAVTRAEFLEAQRAAVAFLLDRR